MKEQLNRIRAKSVDSRTKKQIIRFNYVCYGLAILLSLSSAVLAAAATSGYRSSIPAPNLTGATFGLQVDLVMSNSSAGAMGIHQNDVIQFLNGTRITEVANFSRTLQSNSGRALELKWVDTSGQNHSGTFVVPSTTPQGKPVLGVKLHSLNSDYPIDPLRKLFIERQVIEAIEYAGAAGVLFLAGSVIKKQNIIIASMA